MEKVKVVKPIPGILNVGDVLISPVVGADFCLEEVSVTKSGSNERFVSLDYTTVSDNIPQFFVFDFDDIEVIQEDGEDNSEVDFEVSRTKESILDRYNFFCDRFEEAEPGSEAQIVYKNLMWFIEWLVGKTEVL